MAWGVASRCNSWSRLQLEVYDALSGRALAGATFSLDGSPALSVSANASKAALAAGTAAVVRQGRHLLRVTRVGFEAWAGDLVAGAGEDLARARVDLLPADGLTRAVLRWPDAPAHVDLYAVPAGAAAAAPWAFIDPDGGPAVRPPPLSQQPVPDNASLLLPPGGEEAVWDAADQAAAAGSYSWFGLNGDRGCRCDPADPACAPACELAAGEQAGAASLRLDMDLWGHGPAEADLAANWGQGGCCGAPVLLTIQNPLPGEYLLFVNSYDGRGAEPTEATLEIWMGQGLQASSLAWKETIGLNPGDWWWAGRLQVVAANGDGSCSTGFRQQPQVGGASRVCAKWISAKAFDRTSASTPATTPLPTPTPATSTSRTTSSSSTSTSYGVPTTSKAVQTSMTSMNPTTSLDHSASENFSQTKANLQTTNQAHLTSTPDYHDFAFNDTTSAEQVEFNDTTFNKTTTEGQGAFNNATTSEQEGFNDTTLNNTITNGFFDTTFETTTSEQDNFTGSTLNDTITNNFNGTTFETTTSEQGNFTGSTLNDTITNNFNGTTFDTTTSEQGNFTGSTLNDTITNNFNGTTFDTTTSEQGNFTGSTLNDTITNNFNGTTFDATTAEQGAFNASSETNPAKADDGIPSWQTGDLSASSSTSWSTVDSMYITPVTNPLANSTNTTAFE